MSDERPDGEPKSPGKIAGQPAAGTELAHQEVPSSPDEQTKRGIVEIASEPATSTQPAHVSLNIEGDRKFIVRTSDLENIGAQLRGKKEFSFFYSVGLPIIISLITVAGTTGIAQLFQYISWRNSTALDAATTRTQRAINTFQQASVAISKRYYATYLFLAATRDLANNKTDTDTKLYKLAVDLNQQRFNEFYTQLTSWNEDYDQILTAIDYSLDGPVRVHEHVSFSDFDKKIDCKNMLVPELQRLNLNVDSLKLQFAAINYCFSQSIKDFNDAKDKAIIDSTSSISDGVKKTASDLNEDIRSMSNEFRCFAQHRIGFLEQQKQTSIFKLSSYLYNNSIGLIVGWFIKPQEPAADHLAATLKDCNRSKPSAN